MARGLPAIPRPGGPAQMQETQFGGLNMTNACRPGELEECRNLSSREYPCLSHRPGRTAVPGVDGVTAVFDHGGKLITCRGGRLYLGEKDICAVLGGKKQFAVVNTQLVIWPDKIVISLTEERVLQDCEPVMTADDESTVYDGSSITAATYIPVAVGGSQQEWSWDAGKEHTVYTYGSDREKFLDCRDGTAWNMEKLLELEELTPVSKLNGKLVIPDAGGAVISAVPPAVPDKNQYDTTGLYAEANVEAYTVNYSGQSYAKINLKKYRAGLENVRFYERFAKGDRVDVSGGPFGLTGTEHAEIGEIDAKTNAITFSGAEVLRRPVLYCKEKVGRVKAGESLFAYYAYTSGAQKFETLLQVTPDEDIPDGCVMFCNKGDTTEHWSGGNNTGYLYGHSIQKVRLWHEESRTVYGPYTPETVTKLPEKHLVMEAYPEVYALTIVRSLPELDYICASDNRLWGISNKDKTIWGSSLGKPFDFYTYAGLSTDSYAVAVSGDSNFTGCCEVGGYVAFFQEERVHLLMGSEPSEYATYSYGYKGVQAGSHGSLTMINERLYYLADDGVYSFSASGAPQLMTYNFGTRRFRKAVAGTDGRNYFISMQDRDTGVWGLFVLDTLTGIWLQEDETEAACFTDVNGSAYMAADGVLWKIADTDSDEKVRWSATFCRTEEGTFERKDYSRLLLRYEMEEGSSFKAEIFRDGGPWQTVKEVRSEKYKTSVLPIRPGRCDSFRVRISGEGKILLRSMQREVIARGRK